MSDLNQMYTSSMGSTMNPMQYLVVKMSKSMNFLGIYSIVMGAFTSLSIIGAVIGIPMIFAGIRLRESSEAFKKYAEINDNNVLALALDKQERYFYIQKVLAIVGLVILGLYFLFIIGMLIFVGTSFMSTHSF